MANSTVLITGGAGYIGSHAVIAFREACYGTVVLDNLTTGIREAVPEEVPFAEGDAGDADLVGHLIRKYSIDAVIHFAGSVVVPESVSDPLKYYRNNTCTSRNLIEACVTHKVNRLIFSSTAAVYGIPPTIPVSEASPVAPINPYGTSKLVTEWILKDTAAAHELSYVALRYFNVAGADPSGRTGHSTRDATHLIKVACEAAVGKRPFVEIYGDDYDTPDGTCVRDYVHVTDLVAAHVAALKHLERGSDSLVLNCGYGRGYSVREVLDAVETACGKKLDIRSAPRRAGDPPALVADVTELRRQFEWEPKYNDLSMIVRTALRWEQQNPQNAIFRFTHRKSHINTPNPPIA